MIPFPIITNTDIIPVIPHPIDMYMTDGSNPTLYITLSNGELWGSGQNAAYLGLGSTANKYGDMYLCFSNVKKVVASNGCAMLITKDNKIYHTGISSKFSAGSPVDLSWTDKTSYYASVFDVSTIKNIAISNSCCYILLNNGNVYAHGTNTNGELGSGNTNPFYVPTLMATSVDEIWLSSYGVYRQGNKFYGSGDNSYGQLGVSTPSTVLSFRQILTQAPADIDYNSLRFTQTYVILYTNSTAFYASGRNYSGAWGIGNVSVDQNVTSYSGVLPFVPGDLTRFFNNTPQCYWLNILIDTNNTYKVAGNITGGTGANLLTFANYNGTQNTVPTINAVCSTGTRAHAICDVIGSSGFYVRGSSTTTIQGAGFTPLSTPLPQVLTLISDFPF